MALSRNRSRRLLAFVGLAAVLAMAVTDAASARRSGGFSTGGNTGSGGGGGSSSGKSGSGSSGYKADKSDKSSKSDKSDKSDRAVSRSERAAKADKENSRSRSASTANRAAKKKRHDDEGSSNKSKQARIYIPPKQQPKPPKDRPPRGNRPPVIVLPTPPLGPALPPAVVALPPAALGFLPPRLPTEPPRFAPPPPRRMPLVSPPAPDLARSRDREIIIAMDDTVSDGDTITIGQGFTLNTEVQYRSSLLEMKIVRLRIPDNRSREQVIDQVIAAGLADPRIIFVQPNYVFEASQSAASAATGQLPQYATRKLRLDEAHKVAMGRDVKIAVIDTGLDTQHPELVDAVADTFDAIGEGPADVEAHGTAIAGIVAARHRIQGMAPDARLLAVRAFAVGQASKSEATTLSLIKGLDWAAEKQARVINMSFAGPKDILLQEAVKRAERKGMVLVAAAGNGGPEATQAYPAAYDGVIAVTASDSDDQVYDKANRGSYVQIAAPGVDILTPAPKDAYEMSSGTSLAAAHVSGIIALMLERSPALTSDAIRSILVRTARDPDRSAFQRGLGAGIVDAARAVEAAN